MKRRTGYTLISVVVAGVIVGIAVTLAASALVSGAKLSRQAVHTTEASSFAEGVMERVRSQPFDSISGKTVTNDLPKLPGASCMIDVSSFRPGLKQVVVNCSWRERNRTCKVRLATLVARAGGR